MSGLRRVALLGVVAALALTAAACGGDDSKDAAPAPNGGPAVGQPPGDLTCPPPNIADDRPFVAEGRRRARRFARVGQARDL